MDVISKSVAPGKKCELCLHISLQIFSLEAHKEYMLTDSANGASIDKVLTFKCSVTAFNEYRKASIKPTLGGGLISGLRTGGRLNKEGGWGGVI